MISWLEIFIPLTALLTGYLGWRLGVARLGAIGVGAVASVLVAKSYYPGIAVQLSGLISHQELAEIISFVGLACGVFIATLAVGLVARRLVSLLFLGWLDSSFGAVLGVGIAATLWFVGLDFSTPYLSEGLNEAVAYSEVAQFLLIGFPKVISFLPLSMEAFVASIPVQLSV